MHAERTEELWEPSGGRPPIGVDALPADTRPETENGSARDAALAAAIRDAFQRSTYHPLRRALCRVDGDRVVLAGRVPSFYLKQIAQTIAGQVAGPAFVIDNQLEVQAGRPG